MRKGNTPHTDQSVDETCPNIPMQAGTTQNLTKNLPHRQSSGALTDHIAVPTMAQDIDETQERGTAPKGNYLHGNGEVAHTGSTRMIKGRDIIKR